MAETERPLWWECSLWAQKRLGLEAALSCTWWVLGILGLCSYIQGAERTFRPLLPLPPVHTLLIPKPTTQA